MCFEVLRKRRMQFLGDRSATEKVFPISKTFWCANFNARKLTPGSTDLNDLLAITRNHLSLEKKKTLTVTPCAEKKLSIKENFFANLGADLNVNSFLTEYLLAEFEKSAANQIAEKGNIV